MPGLDSQDHPEQVVERVRQVGVREFVACTPPFWHSDDQSATTQARKVIGHALTCNADGVGKVRRICRPVFERQQDSGSRLIRQGVAEPGQYRAVRQRFHPADNTLCDVFTKG
jgi:hypothetical protein